MSQSKTKTTFTAIRSGDGACFCWKVGKSKLYPDTIMRKLKVGYGKKYKFTVTAEEITDGKN